MNLLNNGPGITSPRAPCAPRAIFAPLAAGQAKVNFCQPVQRHPAAQWLTRASRNARIGTYGSMFIWYFRARKLLT